jgi:hypothetical protein
VLRHRLESFRRPTSGFIPFAGDRRGLVRIRESWKTGLLFFIVAPSPNRARLRPDALPSDRPNMRSPTIAEAS